MSEKKNGKWFAKIQHSRDGYSVSLCLSGRYVGNLSQNVSFAQMKKEIHEAIGIELPPRKDFRFERRKGVDYALIDATQCHGTDADCFVSLRERENGWQPDWS